MECRAGRVWWWARSAASEACSPVPFRTGGLSLVSTLAPVDRFCVHGRHRTCGERSTDSDMPGFSCPKIGTRKPALDLCRLGAEFEPRGDVGVWMEFERVAPSRALRATARLVRHTAPEPHRSGPTGDEEIDLGIADLTEALGQAMRDNRERGLARREVKDVLERRCALKGALRPDEIPVPRNEVTPPPRRLRCRLGPAGQSAAERDLDAAQGAPARATFFGVLRAGGTRRARPIRSRRGWRHRGGADHVVVADRVQQRTRLDQSEIA